MLNRAGYRLKRIQKTKPLKKIAETDAIFANIEGEEGVQAGKTPGPGNLHRHQGQGESRRVQPGRANTLRRRGENTPSGGSRSAAEKKGVPFGLLNVLTGSLLIVFGSSAETSDFWADCLALWWKRSKKDRSGIKRLKIRLDNGPSCASNRRQWIKRLLGVCGQDGIGDSVGALPTVSQQIQSDRTGCGASWKDTWSGTLLTTLKVAMHWASTMTWEWGVSGGAADRQDL